MAFTEDVLSPVKWVSAYATPSSSQKVYVKSPSSLNYEMEDVSESDAGRTEDGKMHKMRIGQVNKLDLTWQNISTTDFTTLTQMFQAETFYVNFYDPHLAAFHTELMYRGNISASMYSNWNYNTQTGKGGIWTLSFSLIRVDGGSVISENNY